MFADIAEKIAAGGVALPLLALDLGITQDQLRERLAMMEHMGYLSRPECPPEETEKGGCGCCSGCSKESGDRFFLTEKGMKLIRKG